MTKTSKTEMEITMQVMGDWYINFCTSKYYSKLGKKAQKQSEFIILDLLSLMFYQFDLKPDNWDAESLEEYCHETLANERHYRGEEYFKYVSKVLIAFFQYLDEMKLHKNIKELQDTIKEHSKCILDSYSNLEEDDGEEYDEAQEITEQWLEEFIKTKYFSDLSEINQINSQDIISSFSDFMYGYTGLKIDKWDTSGLEEVCLDVMPRKIMADDEYFESISPSLHAFFLFMEERKINKNSGKLAKKIKEIESKIIKASKNSSNWGIGKQILGQALDKGIDISDQGKLTKFLNSIMGKPLQSLKNDGDNYEDNMEEIGNYDNIVPFVRKEEKIGRNDLCPCGSGKKYKKCCGK